MAAAVTVLIIIGGKWVNNFRQKQREYRVVRMEAQKRQQEIRDSIAFENEQKRQQEVQDSIKRAEQQAERERIARADALKRQQAVNDSITRADALKRQQAVRDSTSRAEALKRQQDAADFLRQANAAFNNSSLGGSRFEQSFQLYKRAKDLGADVTQGYRNFLNFAQTLIASGAGFDANVKRMLQYAQQLNNTQEVRDLLEKCN